MKIYIVTYNDYEQSNEIRGVFTDKTKAEKCKEYELKLASYCNEKYGDYGRNIKIVEFDCSDDIDFDAKITELEELKRQERQTKEEAIKQKDLEEFNRIKEKYGW